MNKNGIFLSLLVVFEINIPSNIPTAGQAPMLRQCKYES